MSSSAAVAGCLLAHAHQQHRLLAGLLIVCAFPVFAGDAAATIPITKINTVRVLTSAIADGTLTTKVTYTNTSASAAASTGDSIGLAAGSSFLLRTCLAYHLHGTPPVSSCATRSVDTRSNADRSTRTPRASRCPDSRARRASRGGTSLRIRRCCTRTTVLMADQRAQLARRGPAGRRHRRRRARSDSGTLPPNAP